MAAIAPGRGGISRSAPPRCGHACLICHSSNGTASLGVPPTPGHALHPPAPGDQDLRGWELLCQALRPVGHSPHVAAQHMAVPPDVPQWGVSSIQGPYCAFLGRNNSDTKYKQRMPPVLTT